MFLLNERRPGRTRIPPNTGNVARLCAATGSTLHLIEPFGFTLDDKQLKRAGLDLLATSQLASLARLASIPTTTSRPGARFWLVESHGERHYAEVPYGPDDFLVFGRETAGLPRAILDHHQDQWLRIPMFHSGVRSLNLSNCVALVLYEALRQQGFHGEIKW